jgi:2-(1,2-epoxy-1,2-dihydrophenyl)acetyl-CoA isomerase
MSGEAVRTSAPVLTERDGGVLTLTLNRPDVYNAFNRELHAALAEALRDAADPEVRAVVVTGAGKGFCAGQDLKEFQQISGGIRERLEETYHPNIRALRALEKPVLAAVNGPAAGAGLSLACACDVRIASDAATFVPGFIGIGLVPDSGGSLFIRRLLGERAFEWMVSNRRLGADEALAWGLVSEVVPADGFAARVRGLAEWYAALPTRGVALSKQLFDHAASAPPLDEQLELEAELQQAATQSEDFREGVQAFLEKRPPRFRGR